MSDLLRMDYINSLPQPFMATFCGGDEWPVYDIEVCTGWVRIDICGMLDIKDIGEVLFFTDADGNKHDMETFFSDYEETEQTQTKAG